MGDPTPEPVYETIREPLRDSISAEVLLDLADGRKLAFKKEGEDLQVCLEDVCTTIPGRSTTVQELLKLLQAPSVSMETNVAGRVDALMVPDLARLSTTPVAPP